MEKYDDFSLETKEFLNKAMDIYYTIKDREILTDSDYRSKGIGNKLTKFEKRILALFMAGYLVDGKLKTILEAYDDLDLKFFLDMVGILEKDILKLPEGEYSEYYHNNFLLDLESLKEEKELYYDFNEINPEVIISFLGGVDVNGSKILNYFGKKYLDINYFSDHPLFKVIKMSIKIDGCAVEIRPGDKRVNHLNKEVNSNDKNSGISPLIDFNDDSVWELLDTIQGKFIGQEEASEYLFYNIINNQQLIEMDNMADGERSIIFLDGPTGTGKTAIAREITAKVGLPFYASSIMNFSSTGYAGGDIEDILLKLYEKANGDLELAQRGIVVIDEIDKITYLNDSSLTMKEALQDLLLDFLGGGKYSIRTGKSLERVEFDTSKLTFICIGALTKLRSEKILEDKSLIYVNDRNTSSYTITVQDLIKIGLKNELVGRFNTFLHTDDYSLESLINILKYSTISPLLGFRRWVEAKGKRLELAEGVYEEIAKCAYDMNTGARSLQAIMNNIRTVFIKDVLRGKDEVVYLDAETVRKIYNNYMIRKVRS